MDHIRLQGSRPVGANRSVDLVTLDRLRDTRPKKQAVRFEMPETFHFFIAAITDTGRFFGNARPTH